MVENLKLLIDIQKFMQDSKALIVSGNNVDLTGLDKQIQNLCVVVANLSKDDRAKYAEPLQELLAQLTLLGDDLTVQKEALVHEIRYLSSHKKASVAYQTADAKGPAQDQDES